MEELTQQIAHLVEKFGFSAVATEVAKYGPQPFGGTQDPDNDGDTDITPDDPTHDI